MESILTYVGGVFSIMFHDIPKVSTSWSRLGVFIGRQFGHQTMERIPITNLSLNPKKKEKNSPKGSNT